jgi:hypothetical protein
MRIEQQRQQQSGLSITTAELTYVDTMILNLPTRRQEHQPQLAFGQEHQPPFGGTGAKFPERVFENDPNFSHGQLRDPFRRPGDFAGDLAPGGLMPGGLPGHPNLGPLGGGSLMGPNHPSFFPGGVGPPGGMPGMPGQGMHPRFDLYGPPGGPQDPNNQDNNPDGIPSRNPRNPMQPNPDHMRPPNHFNSNMFL